MIEWMNAMSESPRQYHHDYLQATIDTFFRDNTQIRVVKEQSYPFTDTYTEYEAYVDSVADATVAIAPKFPGNGNDQEADAIAA